LVSVPQLAIGLSVFFVFLFTILALILFYWLKRRRQLRRAAKRQPTSNYANTVSPFTLVSPQIERTNPKNVPFYPISPSSDTSGTNVTSSTLRRQYLEDELRTALEKITDLERLQSRRTLTTPPAAMPGSASRRKSRLISRGSLVTTTNGAETEILAPRIEEAEVQIPGPPPHVSLLGDPAEHPPGYTSYRLSNAA
jgi:hypothetical protein